MQENEYKRYEEIGNWDFSDIKYTVEQNSSWDFYKEISKYTNSSSLLLDLGTGGGEKTLSNMPDTGMIIATDFSSKMIETANINKKNYPNKRIKFVTMNNLNMNFIESVTRCLNNILSNSNSRAYYIVENSNCDIYLKSNYKILLTLKEESERSFPYSMKARILELNDILEKVSIYESKIFTDIMDKMHNRSYAANISVEEYNLIKESLFGIVDEGVFDEFTYLCKEEANPDYDKFNIYSTSILEFSSYDDNMTRLQFCAQVMNIPYENENGDIVQEAFNLNDLRLAWQGVKSKIKHLSAKEKEASRDLDASFNNLLRGLKSALTVDHREQIIKGQVNPSLSRILKIAIVLAGIGAAAQSIYAPALAAVAGFALSKHTEKKERSLILDEIDIELKVLDREIQRAESDGSPKKYRQLLTIQKNLQRERQRIYYGIASKGRRLPIPSTVGLRSGKGD